MVLPLRRFLILLLVVASAALASVSSLGEAQANHNFLRFPWQFGKQAVIINGYNSPTTHVNGNRWTLDFQIEGGSTQAAVAAAAGGNVVFVDNGNYSCDPFFQNGKYVDVKSTTLGDVPAWQIVNVFDPSTSGGLTRIHAISVVFNGICFVISAQFAQENPDEETFLQIASSFRFSK